MPKVTSVDGTTLNYEVYGEGGRRTPLILTHGFSATSQMWHENVSALADDRPVLVYDQRGHGQSDAPQADRYTEAASVADIDTMRGVLGVERAIIGGMSLGGYLTLAYQVSHPEHCAALIVQDTGPGFRNDEARAKWNEYAEQTAHRIEQAGGVVSQSVEATQATHANPEALALVARGTLKQYDDRIISSLPSITVPTLVIVGADDTGFLAGTDYMAAKIPNATKVVIPDAGHAANIDQPQIFNDAVVSWLRDIDL